MKLNYYLISGFIILTAYHVYIIKQMVSVNNQLVKTHGTVSKSYFFGSRDDRRVYMELKEFPGIIFLRRYYGFDRFFYNNMPMAKKVNDPLPEMRRLPEDQLKVSFYIFKEPGINQGKEVPYIDVQYQGKSENKLAYYLDLYFYCRGNVSFLSFISLCLSAALMLMGIVYMGRNLGNKFVLTTQTRIILAFVCYAIFLAFA